MPKIEISLRASKDKFIKYKEIQKSGRKNMLASANEIIPMIGCTKEEYMDIVYNYNTYNRVYQLD